MGHAFQPSQICYLSPYRPTTFVIHRGCRWPETRPGPYVVTGTADLDGSDNTTERGSSDCRKSGFTTEGGGGHPAPEPQGSPRGVRAVPNFFTEGRSRVCGLDHQKDIGSPVDILVDTVAQMQQDLTRLRE